MKEFKKKMSLYKINGKEMDSIKGGEPGNCFCACQYENCGGSSCSANSAANTEGGLTSVGPGCA
jgi:hypothetical protein